MTAVGKRYALISVTDKGGVVEFARGLVERGFSILSTGGTFRALQDGGIDATEVADYTGFPEMMDGRVKTLHPKVHGGLLGRRGVDDDVMAEHGIGRIDLVAVNLYRFRETAKKPGVDRDVVVENIDIGGPSMLRSAAKNHASVAVVVDPGDYDAVLEELAGNGGSLSLESARRLAGKAFAHTASYDCAVAGWFATQDAPDEFAEVVTIAADKVQDLRYGENPHQRAALFADPNADGPSLAGARQLGGKELSYNNLLDLDAALALALEFDSPACVIVKHNNPCGSAVAPKTDAAFRAALGADPISAFGGIIALNRPLDVETARAMATDGVFVEAIVAPAVDDAAYAALGEAKWSKNVRVLSLDGTPDPRAPRVAIRPILGGLLVQSADVRGPAPELDCASKRMPTDAERRALEFAWAVCKHVRSNAIVLARAEDDSGAVCATVGVGAGQMSRVDAAKIAVEKAGEQAVGAVLASDAFFPFADGVAVALQAGVTAVIQPGGSKRDDEVIAAVDAAGASMVFTGQRHFRH